MSATYNDSTAYGSGAQQPLSLRERLAATFTMDKYIAVLFKIRYFTIALWVIAGGTSAAFFMQFIADCSQEFNAPEGTPAYTATNKVQQYFPSFVDTMDLAIFVESTTTNGVLLTDLTAPTTQCVESFLTAVGDRLYKDPKFSALMDTYESYYSLKSVGINSLADRLMDPTSTKTIAPIRLWSQFASKEGMERALDVESFIRGIGNEYQLDGSINNCSATLQIVGVPLLINEALTASAADMGKSDGIVLPIALLVMALTVRSLRLMILPCVTVGLSLAVSFAIMCGFTRFMTVSSAAPSLMMSLGICMSIDYCLFVVSRYVQEVRQGQTGHALVARVVSAAGHTILVSGSTLMLSLIALVFFPLNILQSFGWGCSITVLIALVVALTLCPTILLTFPTFFENGAKDLVFPAWVPERIVKFLNHNGEKATLANDAGDAANAVDERTGLLAGDAAEGGAPPRGGISNGNTLDVTNSITSSGEASALRIDRATSSTSQLTIGGEKGNGKPMANRNSTYLTNEEASGGNQSTTHEGQDEEGASASDIRIYRQMISRTIFRYLHITTVWPFNLISFLATCAVAGGMGVALVDFHITDSFALDLPRGYTITTSYERLVDVFGFSYMYPYQIMVELDEGSSAVDASIPSIASSSSSSLGLLGPQFFNYSQGALRFITGDATLPGGLSVDDFSGVLAYGKQWVNNSQISDCLSIFNQSAVASGESGALVRDGNETTTASPPSTTATTTSPSPTAAPTTTAPNTCTMELLSMLGGTVSKQRDAVLMMLFINTDPLGNEGDRFYRKVLDLLDAYHSWVLGGCVLGDGDDSSGVSSSRPIGRRSSSQYYNSQKAALEVLGADIPAAMAAAGKVKFYVSGIGPQSMDAVDTVYRLFPIIIAISAGVVLVVVGLSFRSIAIPIRSVLSIALTELFVFGWVGLVYSLSPNGIFDWLGSPAVSTLHAIPWIDPIVAFSVVLGIALDYDVFLLTRVFELRMGGGHTSTSGAAPSTNENAALEEGGSAAVVGNGSGCLSTHDAILVGVCDTGPIITSAGIIMAIAFLGMLLSAMPLLNVLGMFLVTAVLFDTFIVRTFLGPSAMSLLGEASWWPRRPPMVPSHFTYEQLAKEESTDAE